MTWLLNGIGPGVQVGAVSDCESVFDTSVIFWLQAREANMFWEMYQQWQIHGAEQKAGRAEMKATQIADQIYRLEGQMESLALACQSLWEILRDRTDVSEEELGEKMKEIDLRDGRLDGKLSRVAESCVSCGRTVNRRRRRCLYCGTENQGGEVFGLR